MPGPPRAVSWRRYVRHAGPRSRSGNTRSCWAGSRPSWPGAAWTARATRCAWISSPARPGSGWGHCTSGQDKRVQAVRRAAVLMAGALAGRELVIDQSVIPARDGCPARFRPLRDDYVASCRARGNAEATVATKDKAASRFLGYLDETGTGLAALSVRDVSGFLLRQRGLRRKTVAGLRSALADFLGFLADEGRAPQGSAGESPTCATSASATWTGGRRPSRSSSARRAGR